MTCEIADGWLPLYMSPFRPEVYEDQIAERKEGFEIAQFLQVNINDDLEQALMPVKYMLAFYIGGMGAKKRNFHKELMGRMGYEAEADKVQELFMEGKRAEAVDHVPDAFADEISLCGPLDRIKDRIQAWRETPVTSLLIANRDVESLRRMAEIVL
jgi:alkanesulfonate monooxygenase SsuD/methylene tetrahydromethanopterin reductase-like flavin-dependent oxidoreductase (luciferase family)